MSLFLQFDKNKFIVADNEIVQVILGYDKSNYLLCTLHKGTTWQMPLDLNFQEGTEIAFSSNGRGHVHLTGYLIPDELDDQEDLDEEDDEEDEELENDDEVPQLVGNQIKRKAQKSLKEDKNAKRLKASLSAEPESSDDEDEDDDDDDEDAAEIDDDDDSEDVEDSDEEEEEEEVEQVQVKPQSKKAKVKEQKQVADKKQEKQKLVNGKDAKPEATKAQQGKKIKGEAQQQQQQQQKQQNNAQQPIKKRVVEGGVIVEDIKVGSGAPAKSGKFVSVCYVGRLKNGKKFDSALGGDGFKFRLGKGEVIKGWDIGIAGMKIGGKRRLTIPANMA